MKTLIIIIVAVLVLGGVIYTGALDMILITISGAVIGITYIPLEIRALIYLILAFLVVGLVISVTNS